MRDKVEKLLVRTVGGAWKGEGWGGGGKPEKRQNCYVNVVGEASGDSTCIAVKIIDFLQQLQPRQIPRIR